MYQVHIYVFSLEKLISSQHFVHECKDLRAPCPWYKPSTWHAEGDKKIEHPEQIWLANIFLVFDVLAHEE